MNTREFRPSRIVDAKLRYFKCKSAQIIDRTFRDLHRTKIQQLPFGAAYKPGIIEPAFEFYILAIIIIRKGIRFSQVVVAEGDSWFIGVREFTSAPYAECVLATLRHIDCLCN